MNFVWAVYDYERYDTRDSEEPHLVALFTSRDAALATRKRLEAREHPSARLGYVYRFEITEYVVHVAAFTDDDILRGCADEISPPRVPGDGASA
jgi:hypothetical protein